MFFFVIRFMIGRGGGGDMGQMMCLGCRDRTSLKPLNRPLDMEPSNRMANTKDRGRYSVVSVS